MTTRTRGRAGLLRCPHSGLIVLAIWFCSVNIFTAAVGSVRGRVAYSAFRLCSLLGVLLWPLRRAAVPGEPATGSTAFVHGMHAIAGACFVVRAMCI